MLSTSSCISRIDKLQSHKGSINPYRRCADCSRGKLTTHIELRKKTQGRIIAKTHRERHIELRPGQGEVVVKYDGDGRPDSLLSCPQSEG